MIIRDDGTWPRSATRTAMDLDLTVVGMSTPSRGSTNCIRRRPSALQLFVSEPFNNTIEVVNLVVFGTAANPVFGPGSVSSIGSPSLNLPVDLAPAQRDADSVNWAANTTPDQGSDFSVANRDSTPSSPRRSAFVGCIVAINKWILSAGPNRGERSRVSYFIRDSISRGPMSTPAQVDAAAGDGTVFASSNSVPGRPEQGPTNRELP